MLIHVVTERLSKAFSLSSISTSFYFHGMLHWVNLCYTVVLAMIELINIMTKMAKHSICIESNGPGIPKNICFTKSSSAHKAHNYLHISQGTCIKSIAKGWLLWPLGVKCRVKVPGHGLKIRAPYCPTYSPRPKGPIFSPLGLHRGPEFWPPILLPIYILHGLVLRHRLSYLFIYPTIEPFFIYLSQLLSYLFTIYLKRQPAFFNTYFSCQFTYLPTYLRHLLFSQIITYLPTALTF
jgi:hypothetical protein